MALAPGGFRNTFLGIVNQGVTGSFYGVDEGRRQIDAILATRDWWEEGAGGEFAADVLGRLTADFRHEPRPPVGVDSQLRKGFNCAGLYDFIFGLEYLQPRYALQLDGKDLSQLSPGERGTLLLVFYLLVDLEDIPLVVDQPEENLDNQTVFRLVGACLREARKRRQVVVVTHNPNIAVA
ncbi:MAG: ATP-binding protein [Acidobacteria bacterium]|nr:ATP-binding protein [Acidobacteriota bacterium]